MQLDTVAARARAALRCAQSGSEGEALRIALDIDEVVYEVEMPHGAMRLMGRRRWKGATPDDRR